MGFTGRPAPDSSTWGLEPPRTLTEREAGTGRHTTTWSLSPPPAVSVTHLRAFPASDLAGVALHPEGGFLALTAENDLAFVDAASGEILGSLAVPKPWRLEFTTAGDALWIDSERGLFVVDIESTSGGFTAGPATATRGGPRLDLPPGRDGLRRGRRTGVRAQRHPRGGPVVGR